MEASSPLIMRKNALKTACSRFSERPAQSWCFGYKPGVDPEPNGETVEIIAHRNQQPVIPPANSAEACAASLSSVSEPGSASKNFVMHF